MNRNNPFDKYKISKSSTNKVVLNLYLDSFSIEKVRLQAAKYDKSLPMAQRSVSCYLEFEEAVTLAEDCRSGRIFEKVMKAGDKGYIISRGGSTKSKRYDNHIESRIIKLTMSGDKLFVNLSLGKGKTSDTGAIMPDGKPDVMIGVPVEPAKFRSAMIMVDRHIQAYLVSLTNKLVKESIAEREAGKNTEEELEDAPSEGTVISLEEDGSGEEDGPVEVTAEDEDTF